MRVLLQPLTKCFDKAVILLKYETTNNDQPMLDQDIFLGKVWVKIPIINYQIPNKSQKTTFKKQTLKDHIVNQNFLCNKTILVIY